MANWVLSVEELTISLTGTTGSANLSLGQTIANCFILASASSAATADAGEDLCVKFDIISGPDRVTATRINSAGTLTIRLWVIEVDPTEASIQKKTWSVSSASTSTNVTVTSLTTTDAFIVSTHSADDPFGDADVMLYRVKFTSSTNIEVSRGGTGGAGNGVLWVVEALNSNFSVQHNDFSFSTATSNVTISSISMIKTFDIFTYKHSSTNDNPDENMVVGQLTSSTNYALARYTASGTVTGTLQSITLADDSMVQRGEIVMTGATATDTDTISSVDLSDSVAWLQSLEFGYGIGRSNSSSSYEDGLAEESFDDSVTVRSSRDDTGSEGTFEWEVIDFALVGESANALSVQSSLG